MALDDPELLAEFVTESREHLIDVEGQLLEIEASGANINLELINTVFRAVHSIKGAAGFLGLSVINQLSHSMENVLGRIRNGELAPTPHIVDVMLRAADSLTKLINNVEASNGTDVSVHVEALDEICAASAVSPPLEDRPLSALAASETSADSIGLSKVSPCASLPVIERPAVRATTASASASAISGRGVTTPAENSIRVQVSVLDSLMNLAGELVLGRNQLMQTLSIDAFENLEAVASRLDQVTTELQEAIMRTRMQPIGAVFSRFPRVARDLSARLGKQCDVIMEGKEVEVDKTILEAIGDPLTHLLRNSIDHGVEMPEVRSAAGKNPQGTVALRAYHQAGKVRIDVADDGAGINPAKLRDKAVQKGIISADQSGRMSDREAVRLIFHPGFSTAEKVTEISGRGVGMDVVRANIEKLGGTVDVDSVPGSGTTIQITLPLTLAIIPSLIIRTCGECFAVPQANVLELVRIRSSELKRHIGRVKDAEVLRLRGELLPLVRLDEALLIRSNNDKSRTYRPVNIIVIESGQRHYGLVVDAIVDSEEIVVKPLGRHVKTGNCLAGATILGDGHIALILDPGGIAAKARLAETRDRDAITTHDTTAVQAAGQDVQDLLFFSTTADERFAVPMSLVTRIERIHARDIKTVGHRRVLEYRGSSLPLLRIDEHVATPPMPALERYFVIVFRAAGREAGLVVSHLDDIRQLALEIDARTFRQKGIAGAFVLNGTTMRLIDVVELAELAYPEWTPAVDMVNVGNGKAPIVLFAEDSAFFRRQVSEFLRGKNLEIVECEDGLRAWETLNGSNNRVQVVITDIEMPNMNGFELCRKIKQHPELSWLPVIALTSLASDADMERGRDAGVDEYQVKMDREQVWEAVMRQLPVAAQPTPSTFMPSAVLS